MIKLKELLKEWTDTSFRDLPKRWSKPVMKGHEPDGLTEFERLGGKDTVKEAYIDPDDAGKSINYALDDLKQSLKRVRNPEKWAEKYHRSLPGVIDMMERLIHIFGKMK